ncbi:uncharacterized protein LOC120359044 isoform X2 [Solenopsis invicta]|uniref:uncharacterized protein LOC120359044 isoform X2 n=1 Tax=Solenopsis invicta TaxID=13686 RepID=UPI00193DBA7F|nr:uncharacterized protein LOC120359044 isoform X2 [Solenopsis invicta]
MKQLSFPFPFGSKYSLSCVAEMDFDGSRYFTLNRIMLSSVGLWPYQNKWHVRIQRMFCLLSFLSCIIVQLFTFLTLEYNLDLLVEVLSFIFPCLIVILKYTTYWAKIKSIKKLMEMIKYDWNTIRNEVEYEIIKKHTYTGAFYSQIFAVMTYTMPTFIAFMHLIPNFLDFVAPLNQSRPHHWLILTEYFVDSDEYFYPIFLHLIANLFLIQNTLMSTTSIYVAFIQHTCGMFEIASYRIEHALNNYKQRNLMFGRRCSTCTKIISAVDIHRRVIEFFEFLKETFIVMYFFLLGLGIASLTVSLYRAVITKGIIKNIMPITCVFIHIFYFIFVTYSGQKVLNHSNDFLLRTYNSNWYMMPLHSQKLMLFVIKRSLKNCILLVGGIFVASLEGFATSMSLSLSYFMVLYSVR